MGLYSFLQSAGKALFGGSAAAAEPEKAAAALKAEIEAAGADPSKFEVTMDGDTVKISGTAADQAEREKAILAVGNIAGVARVEDSVAVEKAEPESTMYEVRKGDSLWKIAAANYGDGSKYPAIFEANRPMLSDPDKIYPGQMLRIPPLA
jgi:nucleoid-associated protein YgaU